MILHAAHGHSRHLVPSVIGVVIIIGGKSDGARLHGIRGPFLGKPHIGDGSYAIEAAVRETDAARKEREARGVAAQPRTGLDRGGPPPGCYPIQPDSSHASPQDRCPAPGDTEEPILDEDLLRVARSCPGTRGRFPTPRCRKRGGTPSPRTSGKGPRSDSRSTKGRHCSSSWSSPSAPCCR